MMKKKMIFVKSMKSCTFLASSAVVEVAAIDCAVEPEAPGAAGPDSKAVGTVDVATTAGRVHRRTISSVVTKIIWDKTCGINEKIVIRVRRKKFLHRFQQYRSYRNEIETRNRGEIPFTLCIVPRGLSVAEGP